jgi:hypothetical protein
MLAALHPHGLASEAYVRARPRTLGFRCLRRVHRRLGVRTRPCTLGLCRCCLEQRPDDVRQNAAMTDIFDVFRRIDAS